MTKLQWGQAGEKEIERGLDRGVLYTDAGAVPWNGLISVEEEFSTDVSEPVYIDGEKYGDTHSFTDFAATLAAMTYPDEFLQFDGWEALGEGLSVDGQPRKVFALSYRVVVGDDLDQDAGHRVHILYNLTASPSTTTFETLSDQNAPAEMAWNLSAVPEHVEGYRPTAHAIIDTRYLDAEVWEVLEEELYGTDGFDANLPPLEELTEYAVDWHLIVITDNGDGTWTARGPSELISMLDVETFQITGVDGFYINPDKYEISTTA